MYRNSKTKSNQTYSSRIKKTSTRSFLAKVASKTLIFLITGIRPLLGPASCKFPVTCTKFAVIQLQDRPFFSAIWSIIKRVLSCY